MSTPKPSGAQNRKRRAAELDAALASETGGHAPFAALGPAPLGDADTALAWAREHVLVALEQVGQSPTLPEQLRWRWIRDLVSALGVSHNRGRLEQRIKRMEDERKERRRGGAVKIEHRCDGSRSPAPGAVENALCATCGHRARVIDGVLVPHSVESGADLGRPGWRPDAAPAAPEGTPPGGAS